MHIYVYVYVYSNFTTSGYTKLSLENINIWKFDFNISEIDMGKKVSFKSGFAKSINGHYNI